MLLREFNKKILEKVKNFGNFTEKHEHSSWQVKNSQEFKTTYI